MTTKIIYNNDNGIFKFIENMLNDNNKRKHLILSQIDDQMMEKIDECISEKVSSLYICIDRYLTTKNLFENLLKSNNYINKYVFSNGEIQGNRLNNLIILETEKQIEVLIIPFTISDFNLSAPYNFAMHFSDELTKTCPLNDLLEFYSNKLEYIELSQNYIDECNTKKLFRNEKANTIYKDVNKDEVIQSFRTIAGSDNADEILRVIQSQSKAKKFSLDRSEMSFNIADEENKINNNPSFDDDIEIDIEI